MRRTNALSLTVCVCALYACGLPIDDVVHGVVEHVNQSAEHCEARATTRVSISMTLDATLHETRTWDESDPAATAQFTHNLTAYAAEGQQVELNFYYTFAGERVWQWHVLPGEGSASIGSGELEFDKADRLIRSTVKDPLRAATAAKALGAPITVDYGPLVTKGSCDPTQTSLGTPPALLKLEADGQPAEAYGDCPKR